MVTIKTHHDVQYYLSGLHNYYYFDTTTPITMIMIIIIIIIDPTLSLYLLFTLHYHYNYYRRNPWELIALSSLKSFWFKAPISY